VGAHYGDSIKLLDWPERFVTVKILPSF